MGPAEQMISAVTRHRSVLVFAVTSVVLGFAAGAGIRFLLIQPPELAWACSEAVAPWWCMLREAIIGFCRAQGLGLIAVLAGASALLLRAMASTAIGRQIAGVAIVSGAAGLLLYAPELSAAGLLLGLMRLLRDGSTCSSDPASSR